MLKNAKGIFAFLLLFSVSVSAYSEVKPAINGGINLIGVAGGDGDGGVLIPSVTGFFDLFLYPFSGSLHDKFGIAWGIGFYYAQVSPTNMGHESYYSNDETFSSIMMPMYAAFKYNFKSGEKVNPFIRADIGGFWWWPDERLITSNTGASDWDWWTGFYTSLSGGADIGNHLTLGAKLSNLPCCFSYTYYNMGRHTYEREIDMIFLSVYAGYRF